MAQIIGLDLGYGLLSYQRVRICVSQCRWGWPYSKHLLTGQADIVNNLLSKQTAKYISWGRLLSHSKFALEICLPPELKREIGKY